MKRKVNGMILKVKRHFSYLTVTLAFCAMVPTLLLVMSCVQLRERGPAYSATAQAAIDRSHPASTARREAILTAETHARDQILNRAVQQLRLGDGRTLEEVAIVDPFVRASLQDMVRAAQVTDRTVTDEGLVTVTVRMDLAPIYKLIQTYNAQPVK